MRMFKRFDLNIMTAVINMGVQAALVFFLLIYLLFRFIICIFNTFLKEKCVFEVSGKTSG